MSNKYDTYFPERFVKNRPSIIKAIKTFTAADLDNNIDTYHNLREFVRNPVPEWHIGAFFPDHILDERDEIQRELHGSYSFVLENPTEESRKEFLRQNEEMKTSEIWKRWQDFLKKTEGLRVKNYPRLEEETETTKSVINFYKNGRNIFSLSPILIHLLNHTDIGNIRFSDIRLPYNSIFLHFGTQTEIEYPVDLLEHKHDIAYELQNQEVKYYLDGAFVTLSREYCLDIRLTFIDSRENFDRKVAITKDFRYPTINFTLDFGKWDLENKTYGIDDNVTFNHSAVCFYDPKTQPSEIEFHKMHALTKQPENCGDGEWEEYVLFDKSLMIIVNALCYLNFVDSDIEISATNEHAAQLENELSKTKKHQLRNKIIEKLKKLSYSKIHFCGNRIENEFKITASGVEVEPHWRRGHWRNQPFGSGLTSRKLIWIKPTIVRKDKGEPEKGHIYDV